MTWEIVKTGNEIQDKRNNLFQEYHNSNNREEKEMLMVLIVQCDTILLDK